MKSPISLSVESKRFPIILLLIGMFIASSCEKKDDDYVYQPFETNSVDILNESESFNDGFSMQWFWLFRAESYEFEVSTTKDFSNIVLTEAIPAAGEGTLSHRLSGLEENQLYYARVRALAKDYSSQFSAVKSYQTTGELVWPANIYDSEDDFMPGTYARTLQNVLGKTFYADYESLSAKNESNQGWDTPFYSWLPDTIVGSEQAGQYQKMAVSFFVRRVDNQVKYREYVNIKLFDANDKEVYNNDFFLSTNTQYLTIDGMPNFGAIDGSGYYSTTEQQHTSSSPNKMLSFIYDEESQAIKFYHPDMEEVSSRSAWTFSPVSE